MISRIQLSSQDQQSYQERAVESGSTRGNGQALESSLQIRQARQDDASSIARLCSEVFGPLTFRGFPAMMKAYPQLQSQAKYEIYKDVDTQLRRALDIKDKARAEAREYRIVRQNSIMQAELRQLAGLPASLPGPPSRLQEQALRKWQRARRLICLAATDGENASRIVGCAIVSMAAPEAFLPAPFPSRAPLRCCISNVAVDVGCRRRGVASRLLRRCETIVQRWGFSNIWLHTEVSNTAAIQLYQTLGYERVKTDPSLFGPFQRILFRKSLQPLRSNQVGQDEVLPGGTGSGTYSWNISGK